MSEPQALFADLFQDGARLIRTATPPDLDALTAGDMVICHDEWDSLEWVAAAEAAGVHVRTGAYRHEQERVISRRTRRALAPDYPEALAHPGQPPGEMFDPDVVAASTAAFAQTWDALSAPVDPSPTYTPASGLLPQEWLPYLPFPTLNPAQAQALPAINSERSVMVVAPTGAGKTVMGMIAALREIKGRGGKAAWLVPQRSLTAELDRELDTWRRADIKVVTLSGEAAADVKAAQNADLWVATTEKFEALSRSMAMRQTIAQIGTLVVDEIHLLGEPQRGPLLETLLARIRATTEPQEERAEDGDGWLEEDSPDAPAIAADAPTPLVGDSSGVRLVGLSATASNAQQVADWLGADLVTIAWRPTRLTQQVLTIPTGERSVEARARNLLATHIANEVRVDRGSTLIFCGTKANVRATALAVAASRGADVAQIAPDDLDAIAEATSSVGVGLHYSDWPAKRDAERGFRERTLDTLVATSTLAAGVNTPARVVVVRDTSIGPNPMEVSMIQQMFGRAGRAGQEQEGWAYLVSSANETGRWRQRLAAGYTITSGLAGDLADHALGEVVQGRIASVAEMDRWWTSTFAHHQGVGSAADVVRARDFLERWGFIEITGPGAVRATRTGSITSKMMVPVADAANLLASLNRAPIPSGHLAAESVLIDVLVSGVGSFTNVSDVPEHQSAPLRAVLSAEGDVRRINRATVRPDRVRGVDVVRAGLLLAARSPTALAAQGRLVAGVPRSILAPALYDTPRYFAWAYALGSMNLLPPWVGVVAGDLGARVTHHRLAPPRGAGRVLRACERSVGSSETGAISRAFRHAREDPHPAGVTIRLAGGALTPTTGLSCYVPEKGRWARVPAQKMSGVSQGQTVAAFAESGDWFGTRWLAPFAQMQG